MGKFGQSSLKCLMVLYSIKENTTINPAQTISRVVSSCTSGGIIGLLTLKLYWANNIIMARIQRILIV